MNVCVHDIIKKCLRLGDKGSLCKISVIINSIINVFVVTLITAFRVDRKIDNGVLER